MDNTNGHHNYTDHYNDCVIYKARKLRKILKNNMTDQKKKELDYLRHVILNGTAIILGSLKEVEDRIFMMSSAVKSYQQKWEEEPDNEN